MLDQLTPKNVKFLIVGYLNSEESSYEISNSMDAYELKHLIKCPTCYKSVSKSSSTKFFLKVKPLTYIYSKTIKVGFLDFHVMIMIV